MKYLFPIAVLLAVTACGPQLRVYTDHDPEYEIRNFKTFAWGDKTNIEAGKNPLHYNELNDKRIKFAVVRELGSKGYEHSENDPDLIIHYHIIVDDRTVVTTEPYGYFYGPYWMRMRTNTYSYREGSLIIDLMDPKTNSLIWRGWATADLDQITPDKTADMIDRAVTKIFKSFPRCAVGQGTAVSSIDLN